jgi:hypothetical protein
LNYFTPILIAVMTLTPLLGNGASGKIDTQQEPVRRINADTPHALVGLSVPKGFTYYEDLLEAKRLKEIARIKAVAKARAVAKEKKRKAAIKAKEARLRASQVVKQQPIPKVYHAPTGCTTYRSPDPNVQFIISMESGGNSCARNPNSGACGLFQALPCSKMGCSLSDVACQVAWGTNYMVSRYGSTANAVAFWKANHWY